MLFSACLVTAEKVVLPIPCVKRFYLGSILSDLICLSLLLWEVRVGMIQ